MSYNSEVVQAIMKTSICHNCGGELVRGFRIANKTEQIVRCLQCNLEFDRYNREYYRELIDSFIFDKDISVLEIGLKGQLRNIEYEIVGRVKYQDESATEKSTWDEWILKASNGKFGYIIEENDRIYFYRENSSTGADAILPPDSISYTGRIVLIEGDIPCKVEIGDGVQFHDFKISGEHYTFKSCNKIDTFLKGTRISLREVIESFNIEKFQESFYKMNTKWKSFKQESRVYALGMIIVLILSAYNCFGDTPIKGIMNSKKVLSENLAIGEGGDKTYESQILYGAFDVPEKNKLHNVSINTGSKLLETDVLTFRLVFIEENRLAEALIGKKNDIASLKETFDKINAFINPIESYAISGYIYSAGGNSRGKEFNFVVDESGKYFFYLEIFSNCIIDIDSITISMSKTESIRYYVIAAFIFLILGIICIRYSRYYKEFTKSML